MDPIIMKIAAGFNIKPTAITKSKYYYIIRTSKGSYTLRHSQCDGDKLKKIHEIKTRLSEQGLEHIEKYYMSVQGNPYYYYDSCYYILSDYYNCGELNLQSTSEVSSAVSALATAHSLAKGYIFEKPIDLYTLYSNKTHRLMQIKKKISNKNHLSDLDVLFLRNYDYYYGLCGQALNQLKEINYTAPIEGTSFCHNAYKEDNILISHGNVYITNWERMSNCHFTYDLVYFINRYIKKVVFPMSDDMPTLSFADILSIYNDNNLLEEYEMGILQAQLIFPDKYLQICDEYYTKNRSWAPVSITSHLKEITVQKEFYADYINIK